MTVCLGILLILPIALRFGLIWENRRRDRHGLVDVGRSFQDLDAADLDKTDKELLQFRYVY